jgi:hypothetical protein
MSNGLFLRTVRHEFQMPIVWHFENAALTCSAQQVRVVEGQGKLKMYSDKNTASGTSLDRQFCTECGSNVLLSTGDPELGKKFIDVALGTLDDEIDWSESTLLGRSSPLLIVFSLPPVPKRQLFSEGKRHWVSGIEMDQKPEPEL